MLPRYVAGALFLFTFATVGLLSCRRGETAPADASTGSEPAAAATSSPADKEEAPLERLDLPLAWIRLPLLPSGVRPKSWQTALSQWNTATTAYARGDLDVASDGFLGVAETLNTDEAGTVGRVSATGRCLAYENAARALRSAGRPHRARALLKDAGAKDPGCKHSMALRLSRLNRVATASSSVRRAGN